MNQLDVRDHLVKALRTDLVGPMHPEEVLPNPPARWYLTGFLVPRGAPDEQRVDPTAVEELAAAGGDSPAGDDAGTEAPASTRRPFLPSSLGVSFLVPADCDRVEVEGVWGEYAQLDDEETRAWRSEERSRWSRDEADARDDDDSGGSRFPCWKRTGEVRVPVTVSLDARRFSRELPGTDGVLVEGLVDEARAPGLPEGTRAVSLFLVNGREPIRVGADARTLFQAGLVVRCAQGFQPRNAHNPSPHPDDRRNDLQYRDRREWAVGHGVSTVAVEHDGAVHEIRTTWMPEASVYRMAAEVVDGVPLDMEALAELESPHALSSGVEALLTAYGRWIADQRARTGGLEPASRRHTAQELMDQADVALGRIRQGLTTLIEDPDAFRAFQLTNRAMAAAARRVRPGDAPRWRLFQLAFLLLNLRSVVEPDDPHRDTVELLFFPTGGGKTEAYLGVAAFTMLLRRIRGRNAPHGGAGVAVLLRYTLRLLTLDQLGRAATLTCALEQLRREDPALLGRERFSVGLWVGNTATPGTFDKFAEELTRYTGGRTKEPPVPLVACPWCGQAFEPESFDLDRKLPSLRIGCADHDCDFAFEASDSEGLPLVYIDEQVYRVLPTFLIGTVDKFASLPWRGAVGALFGRVRGRGPSGYIGHHEEPPRKGAQAIPGGLLPPELVIQDELHLITGPLGTMVGLYETAIDALCRGPGGHGPKIVASTATASRATEQIQALYARSRSSLFPPQGLDDGDTFFARTDCRDEVSRRYLGVSAPGRSQKATAARVFTTLLAAAQRAFSQHPAGKRNPADPYMTLTAYFNSLRELGGAQRLVMEEVAPRVARIDRRRPLNVADNEWFERRLLGFDVLELTSRQSTSAIRKAKGLLERSYSPSGRQKADVLLASSMISVGVDIPRLGLMVVNGQPRTVAEYIQASSRVGRASPGLVVTLLNQFKPRDRSHYERFTAFHESFYRYVEASSVTPFSARAVDRGLAGLTVGAVRHLASHMAGGLAAQHIAKAGDADEIVRDLLEARVRAHRVGVRDDLVQWIHERSGELLEQWRAVADEMAEAAGRLRYSEWEKLKGAQALLSTPVDPLPQEPEGLARFRAPTSMRDVEPSVHIWVNQPQRKQGRTS